MQFAFFIPRHSKNFLENHRFCWKSGNDADSRGRDVCSLRPYDTVRTIIRKISMWLTSNVTTIWKPVYWFLQEMKWIVSIRWNKSSKMPKNVHNLTNLVNSLYSATITHCTKKLNFQNSFVLSFFFLNVFLRPKKIILLFPEMRKCCWRKKSSPRWPRKKIFLANLIELFKYTLHLKNYSNSTFLCWKTKNPILYFFAGKKRKFFRIIC